MTSYKEIKNITVEQIKDLFSSVGWRIDDEPSKLLEALKNSETLITAWDEDRLIGLVNAFSDTTRVVYFHYVLTHCDYQRQGIGKQLVNRALNKYQDYKHLVLISNNEKIDFFKKCGFYICEGATAMEIRTSNTGLPKQTQVL
jgi:N-acetylglutamate synthase-like GNAT family acetyltransferase